MRQKRAKAYRKLMSLYSMSFGFRQPYQVLGAPPLPHTRPCRSPHAPPVDSEMCTDAISHKIELAKQLARSSYVLHLEYEVSPDAGDFGGAGVAVDLNAAPGTLRWTDLPDPLRDTPVIQRKKVEIPDQRNLLAAMADNGHT